MESDAELIQRPRSSSLVLSLRRHPFTLFGLPFLSLIVLSSFALSGFTQTRYDYRDQKVQSVSKEDELGMRKDRRKIDVREEYWVRSLILLRETRLGTGPRQTDPCPPRHSE